MYTVIEVEIFYHILHTNGGALQ
ncbi:Uncharacterized protein F54H12.2, partial [Araneus ventricosus]